jgi:hypothetical protein
MSANLGHRGPLNKRESENGGYALKGRDIGYPRQGKVLIPLGARTGVRFP